MGSGLSTGPLVVLSISMIVLISFLFAPNRGLVWNWLRRRKSHQNLRVRAVLSNLYRLAQQHDDLEHAHETAVLRTMNFGRGGVRHSLAILQQLGWVKKVDEDRWALTPAGALEAKFYLSGETKIEE